MSNNSTLPIIAVGALGLSSISCVISSLTGFLVLGDSNVESNTSTDTSNTSTDTSNTSTDTSNTSTSNTSTESDYTIPHQISLGTDGWCDGKGDLILGMANGGIDVVHQDVPGCGRICSSQNKVGSKRDGTWGPWADNSAVASTCTGAKLDEIWIENSTTVLGTNVTTRKLADGYTLSGLSSGTITTSSKSCNKTAAAVCADALGGSDSPEADTCCEKHGCEDGCLW